MIVKINYCGKCDTIINIGESTYEHFDQMHCDEGYHPDDDWPDFELEWIYQMEKLEIICKGCRKALTLIWGEEDDKPQGYIICTCGKSNEIPWKKADIKTDRGKADG